MGTRARRATPRSWATVKQQAQRDKEQMRSGNDQPPPAMMGRMFNFMRGNVGNNATPTQRARGTTDDAGHDPALQGRGAVGPGAQDRADDAWPHSGQGALVSPARL
jgi:hypothetical protein